MALPTIDMEDRLAAIRARLADEQAVSFNDVAWLMGKFEILRLTSAQVAARLGHLPRCGRAGGRREGDECAPCRLALKLERAIYGPPLDEVKRARPETPKNLPK